MSLSVVTRGRVQGNLLAMAAMTAMFVSFFLAGLFDIRMDGRHEIAGQSVPIARMALIILGKLDELEQCEL